MNYWKIIMNNIMNYFILKSRTKSYKNESIFCCNWIFWKQVIQYEDKTGDMVYFCYVDNSHKKIKTNSELIPPTSIVCVFKGYSSVP